MDLVTIFVVLFLITFVVYMTTTSIKDTNRTQRDLGRLEMHMAALEHASRVMSQRIAAGEFDKAVPGAVSRAFLAEKIKFLSKYSNDTYIIPGEEF